jgi:hypothetical protein
LSSPNISRLKKAPYFFSSNRERIFLILLAVFFFAATFIFNFKSRQFDQFSYLAQAFIQGKLHFLDPAHIAKDAVKINDNFYWHLGPFPAVLLMPFVLLFGFFHQAFHQGYLQFFITVGVFASCFKIARSFRFSSTDSLYLAFAFCFASVYQFTAFVAWCYFFAHALTVFLLLLVIVEYLGRKNNTKRRTP